MSTLPCPNYVVVEGRRIYCEQGEDGHEGTCCGDRSEWEYKALRNKAQVQPDAEPDANSRAGV